MVSRPLGSQYKLAPCALPLWRGPQLPLWRAELRVRNESDVTELGTPSSADTSTAASDNETGEVTHFKLIVKSTFLEFVQADDFRLMRCKSAPALHEGASQMPSVGSSYWKSGGCHNGTQCLHCHLCPQGELQRRKKLHKILAKGRSTERSTKS
eukprot:g1892.t1